MDTIPEQFRNEAFRRAWLSKELNAGLATQIRAMREHRGWTQAELGRRIGVTQERVSELEDPSYGRYAIRTLRRIASVFGVGLVVRFASWSAVLTAYETWPLVPPSFEEEFGATDNEEQ